MPVTTASLDFLTLADYVTDLRARPKVSGVWRGTPDALARSLLSRPVQTLSANSVNAYMRPLRSLAIWLVDEGLLDRQPVPSVAAACLAQSPTSIRGDSDQERNPR